MHNLPLRKSDAPNLQTALEKAEKELSALRAQNGGDEAARLRKITTTTAVVRSFERLLAHSQKAEVSR